MIPLRIVVAPALFVAAGLAACGEVPGVTYATRTAEVAVSGMTCGACEKTICAQVSALKGVDRCEASFDAQKVVVTYKIAFADDAAISAKIREAGYEVVSIHSR